MLSNKARIIIEIDEENETYNMDVSYCNASKLLRALEDIVKRIKTGDLFKEPTIEVTENN